MPPKVLNHFKKVDTVLYKVAKEVGGMKDLPNRKGDDLFMDLVDAIVSQQLSGKVAEVIFNRLKALFPKEKITPALILKLNDEKIRKIGMSYSKIKYVKDLASKVQTKELHLELLENMEDEDVIEELVRVKGIGRWTAEMFLIFTIKRNDVFSFGDLGLKNAIMKIYKMQPYKPIEAEKIVARWSPYRSYAARILWKSLDNR